MIYEDNESELYSPAHCNCIYIDENELESFLPTCSASNLNLLHINCRSMNKNFDKLQNLLDTMKAKFTIIAVTETWLSKTTDELYNLEGYNFTNISRTDKKGGGVALYIDTSLSFTVVRNLTFIRDNLECLCVTITGIGKLEITIGCI